MIKIFKFLLSALIIFPVFLLFQNCSHSESVNGAQFIASQDETIAPVPPPAMPTESQIGTPGGAVASPQLRTEIVPNTSWYWQLQGTISENRAVSVYDIDLFDNTSTTFLALKSSGKKVICYFSAGTYENWRADAKLFPLTSLGSKLGWPGEKWLDIRDAKVREIMTARLEIAKSKGCDGVEPDNVDGYANNSGFKLTKQDQIDFLVFLSQQAHARGMNIGLKNATDLVQDVVSMFDFAVVEECFKYNECAAYSPFIQQNKAVLNAEYDIYSAATCSKAKQLQFSTVFFNLNLNGAVFKPCP